MKKILLYLLLLSGVANAQTTYTIPGDTAKAKNLKVTGIIKGYLSASQIVSGYQPIGTYLTPSSSFPYSQLTGVPSIPAQFNPIAGTNITITGTYPDLTFSAANGGNVASVFGRTGIVVAANGDYTFAQIGSKPTTLLGYGITDAYPLSGNPSNFLTGITSSQVTTALGFTPYDAANPAGYLTSASSLLWSKLTGVPTTLSGYGITDAIVLQTGSYANPLWITSLAYSKLTGAPTNVSSFTNDAGYITTTPTYTATNGVVKTGNNFSSDTTYNRTVANSYSLAGLQTKLNSYLLSATAATTYTPLTRTLTAGTGMLTIGDLSSNRTIAVDTTVLRTVANSYTLAALQTKFNGYVPTGRTLTINGTALDLSANRSFSVGTVTSLATGYGLSGGTVTTTGTLLADTTTTTGLVSKSRLATNLGGYVPKTTTVAGIALSSNVNLGTLTISTGLTGSSYNPSSASTIKADTSVLQTVLNFFPKADTRYAKITSLPAAANPTGTAGTSAVNGVATTFMRSDAAPKVDTTALRTVANSYTLSALQTKLNTYTLQTRNINTGLGLSGGGNLTADRTVIADTTVLKSKAGALIDYNNLSGRITTNATAIAGKQATLVSGTNIKTVNSITLLGSGDLPITTANTDTTSTGFATHALLSTYLTKAQILALGYITGNQTISFAPTGDVTGSTTGTTSLTPVLSIGSGKVTNTMLAGSIDVTTKLTGTLQAAQFPALTGDVTTTAGSLATSLSTTIAPTMTGVWTFSPTNTASSGTTNYGFKVLAIGNQTSTAGFTDFFLNSTGTFGSSTHNLMDLWSAGVTKFTVSNTGFISDPSGFGMGGSCNINTFSTNGSNSVDALLFANTAPAASGTPSLNSNRTRFMASAWNTTATAAANYAHIINELRATTGSTPTAAIYWAYNLSTTQTPGAFSDIMKLSSTSDLSLLNSISTKHIIGSSSAPTIAAGTGAGTTPTVSMGTNSNDTDGILNITTGTTPTGSNAIVATITFNGAYATAPKVLITPGNRAANGLAIGTQVLVPVAGQTNGVTTTTFVIESNTTALAASTAYIWTYHVIQ